jgi:uncharacterized membrane protein HdeD (DUF308 family)
MAAMRLQQVLEGGWPLALSGLFSILLGEVLAVMPDVGLFAWVWMIGIYSLLSGILLLTLAFRLRGLRHPAPRRDPAAGVAAIGAGSAANSVTP